MTPQLCSLKPVHTMFTLYDHSQKDMIGLVRFVLNRELELIGRIYFFPFIKVNMNYDYFLIYMHLLEVIYLGCH